jgi:hypothetical protein
VAPATLSFGNVSVNTNATQVVTVTNIGVNPALVTAPTLTGTNANQFAVAANTCPASLSVGASCTISVRFAPTSDGSKLASLSVNTSNVGSATVGLSGNGVTPLYIITPSLVNFGNQGTGTSSTARQFILTNNTLSLGELWLTGGFTLANLGLGGTNNTSQFQAAFRAGDTCTASSRLAIGASCTFSVVFAPTSNGCKWSVVFGACLVNVSNTTVDVQKASGFGVPAFVGGVAVTAASRSITSPNLNFGNVVRGQTSAARTVTFTNTGFVAIPVTSIAFSGANAANWTQTNTCGTSVPVNGSCDISVRFAPRTGGTTGARNDNLRIIDSLGTTNRAVSGNAQ